jgi:hypothetical protein
LTVRSVFRTIATACFASRRCFFPLAAVALAIFAHRPFTPLSTGLGSVTPSHPTAGRSAQRQLAAARSAVAQEGAVVEVVAKGEEVVVAVIVVVLVVELAASSSASAPARS